MRQPAAAVACVESLLLGGLSEGDRDALAAVQWIVGKVLRIEQVLVAISQGKAVKE
jgi:hypothetical protein